MIFAQQTCPYPCIDSFVAHWIRYIRFYSDSSIWHVISHDILFAFKYVKTFFCREGCHYDTGLLAIDCQCIHDALEGPGIYLSL